MPRKVNTRLRCSAGTPSRAQGAVAHYGWLTRGEMVKISSFGSFAVRRKGQRVGRNPKTRQEVPINPRRVLEFRASPALKRQIDQALTQPDGQKVGQGSDKKGHPL